MMSLSKQFQYYVDQFKQTLSNASVRKAIFVMVLFATLVMILFSNFTPKQVMLRTDEVAKRNIVSPVNAVVVDEQKTQELQKQAAANVQKAYQEDKEALPAVRAEISDYYANLRQILAGDKADRVSQVKNLLEEANTEYTPTLKYDFETLARYLLNADATDIDNMEQANLTIMSVVMSQPITQEAIATTASSEMVVQADSLNYAPEAEEIIKLVGMRFIRPNLIYNEESTQKAIQEAKESVQPVQKTIKAGEIIVREGDRVTEDQISTLEQLGIQRSKSYPLTLLGVFVFVLISYILVMEYLRRYYREIYENEKQMLLLGLVVVMLVVITRILTIIQIGDRPEINALTGYLAPIAAGSMLIAILLDTGVAYFMTMMMALYVGLLTSGSQLSFVIVAFVGGMVGVYRVSRVSQTADLARSGIYIAGANMLAIFTMSMIVGNIPWNTILLGMLLGAINGIVSAVLTIGLLPYLESAFGITSMIRLLELSNPNQNLLKKLLMAAPGTYHHSLMVANLAEATAVEIGANPLLVRVGAYYHDVGKIKRPEYFVENQGGFHNPHEKIAPALSALIITSHVKEGIELANEEHLPEDISDFIAGHHGTSLARYFYNRALEEEGEEHINEENYRYEGPKPQSKEVALVMLADSVEAAVRSLPDPTMEKIREMVRRIIREKLDDGQLEECDLTFKDLDVISRSFCKVLEGVYHKRIEYPETIAQELTKRREQYGDTDHQSTGQG